MMQGFNLVKWIWALTHLFCISVFALQLFYLLPNYLSPTMTFTEVRDVELEKMDFPFDFLICAHPLLILNDTPLQKFGYDGAIHDKYGRSKFNSSFVGWAGHTEQFGAVSDATEVLRLARKNVSGLIERVDIYTHSENKTQNVNILSKITLEKVSWVDDCHVLNMSNVEIYWSTAFICQEIP